MCWKNSNVRKFISFFTRWNLPTQIIQTNYFPALTPTHTHTFTHSFQIHLIKMHKLSAASMLDKSNSRQHKKNFCLFFSLDSFFFPFDVCLSLYVSLARCVHLIHFEFWISISYSYRSLQVKRMRERQDIRFQCSTLSKFILHTVFCFCCGARLIQTIDSFEMLHFLQSNSVKQIKFWTIPCISKQIDIESETSNSCKCTEINGKANEEQTLDTIQP